MRRRTNAKTDPARNTQLRDGEVQFEPVHKSLGLPLFGESHAISVWPVSDGVQVSAVVRGTPNGRAYVNLDRTELTELIEHLTLVRDALPS